MRRRYLTAGYADVIAAIRSDFPDAGIGADVIVGFPGETDAHFEATHAFLADVPLSYLHVFSYSARPNTPAARMSGAVDPAVRSRRSDALRALSIMKKRNFAGRFIGTTPGVLIESEIRDGMMEGFTENYLRVQVAADESAVNRILPVRLISYDHEKGVCRGEVVCE
jgi:threonylcarbamoyladenosine tRNA methylthiotransferase MtaB